MEKEITAYIRAGYPGLYIVSAEDQRIAAEVRAIAEKLNFSLHVWNITQGLVDVARATVRPLNDPSELLLAIKEAPHKSLFLLQDLHLFLGNDINPVLLGQLKDVLRIAKTENKVLVIVGCRLALPPELEREITVIDYKLPGKDQLKVVLAGIIESAQLPALITDQQDAALSAASGLTTIEAENAYALSVVENGGIAPDVIARIKADSLKKNGILEVVDQREGLDRIGGLEVLKSWLLTRKEAFSERARAYGLPIPKGLLIVGVPGTGKSLTAKATASVFNVPLLKLDAGRIFGGLVGQSEGNLRSAIQTAEAIAPCVLWIDEVEKGFAGSKSSGSTDGGTSARVFGSFISWMQEKTTPVFVVATANDVTQLPPEFLRKGRWDELFFVDLPNLGERETIWRLQISKFGRDPAEFDCNQLARETEGFTGAEIESAFTEALFTAFDSNVEATDLTIAGVLTTFVPLSKLMNEQISALRKWAGCRAKAATAPRSEQRTRKLAA